MITDPVINIAIYLFGIIVVTGQILLIILILSYMLFNLDKKSSPLKSLFVFLSQNALSFSFLVSASAVFGSLFLSLVAKIPPCDLCWYQRIFMFPQALILGMALFNNDIRVRKYINALSFVGIAIAIYHYILQRMPSLPTPCTNEVVSCTQKQIELFGYLTIPLMSATAFALILFFMILVKKN